MLRGTTVRMRSCAVVFERVFTALVDRLERSGLWQANRGVEQIVANPVRDAIGASKTNSSAIDRATLMSIVSSSLDLE